MASPSQILNDQANGARLSRLLVNKGTQALRAAFDVMYRPPTLAAVLNTNKPTLQKLRYKVINPSQWKLLYPSSGSPDSQNFDVTLLTVLLRNICGLTRPASGWNALPPDSDTSVAANIARIKFYRNEVHAHITTTEITDNEFENLWLKISEALIGLGISKSELDELKEAPLSPEEAGCIQVLQDWCKSDADDVKEILAEVRNLKRKLEQQSCESESVSVINKLAKCDFSGSRRSLNKKFLPGTRQWLFNKLNAWFTDKDSDSTVMILTAGPGVGKSVFAAEVCRMYAEQGQLAACHFCQYNKTDYSNPRMIIESLASKMCDNVKDFKAKLDDQLQRNHSRETLSDAFRVLVNDPLYALGEREPILFVIDALDESEVGGKTTFLELISDEFPKLPQWIKILITSRPELPVKEKLQHLNPVEITPHDTKNEDDLLKYLRNSLSHICDDDKVLASLTRKCEGSFLYAYYTQLDLKETTKQLTTENISELVPKGIGGFYEKQFKHLKNQLNNIGPSEVKIKRFLQVLVAAKGPLPLSLLPECLELPDDIEYEVRESIIGIMSSILPVYKDCLTVYHKSLRDWLMSDGYKKHTFTVDSHSGHEYLWRACKKVFDQIISSSTLSSLKPCPIRRYALAHGISHMIQSGSESSYHLSVDVRIIHAMIMTQSLSGGRFDYEEWRVEMVTKWKEIVKNSLSSLSSECVQELNWHMELFNNTTNLWTKSRSVKIWNDLSRTTRHSSFYLQSVANRINFSKETKLLARSLLEQGHYSWFEDLDATKLTNQFWKSVSLRTDVTCMCVSSNEQLVAAGFKDGWISIFRVPDFLEVHTFDTMPESNAYRSMLLHGRCYGHTVSGSPLLSCSFSPSSVRLVTCDGSEKVKLWKVNSGNLLAGLQAGGPVDCCFFSECGLFILGNKERNEGQGDVFTVWNTLTLQRVDRRNLYSSLRSVPDRKDKSQLLPSINDDYVDEFQFPDVLPVAQLYKGTSHYKIPQPRLTRYHTRHCVFHHTNESIKFTEIDQLEKRSMTIPPIWNFECPCSYLKANGLASPVTVQKLYVVPFFNKLNIFSIADQPLMSIQHSFVSEPYDISCCCFSPDGSFLATCAPLSVLIWDTKLCTVIQVLRFPVVSPVGCWWSESLLWIYNGDLVKIPISNGGTLDPSGVQRVEIDWKPTKLLTFSDVLIFIDQEQSVNVARIKNGELQYVEKLPVDNPIPCVAVSPCNSIILMATSELTFHVWREDQTSQPHWVASTNGDVSRVKDGEYNSPDLAFGRINPSCKCCITSDSTKGVLVWCTGGGTLYYFIVVNLTSKIRTRIITCMGELFSDIFDVFAGNSYYLFVDCFRERLLAANLTRSEVVAQWVIFPQLRPFQGILAHSKNDLVACISTYPAGVQFLKIVVPE